MWGLTLNPKPSMCRDYIQGPEAREIKVFGGLGFRGSPRDKDYSLFGSTCLWVPV